MNYIKRIKRFKLLTPSRCFIEQINKCESVAASALYARLVYSWLAYRSRHNSGSSVRSICRELGLHPTTVSDAIISLSDLIERHEGAWIARQPPKELFIIRSAKEKIAHWSDGLAYLTLMMPRKGAIVKYPSSTRRFGLNHAIVFSYLASKAKSNEGVVRRFTMAGAAKMFGLSAKTVSSIINDLLWLRLIRREDLGRCSDITVSSSLSEDQIALFEERSEPVGKNVEPAEKLPRTTTIPYHYHNDVWDHCRHLCEGQMSQMLAENAISKAKRLIMTPEDFDAEFHRLRGFHEKNILEGKISKGNFGRYLVTCFDSKTALLDEQERKEQERLKLEEYYRSPEFTQRRAEDKQAAAADPLHPKFTMSVEAIRERVHLDESPIIAVRKLDKIKERLHGHVRPFVKARKLNFQDEVDEIGNLKGKILKHTLADLNGYYRKPVLATLEEFQRGIDKAIAKVEPTMKPLFAEHLMSTEAVNE